MTCSPVDRVVIASDEVIEESWVQIQVCQQIITPASLCRCTVYVMVLGRLFDLYNATHMYTRRLIKSDIYKTAQINVASFTIGRVYYATLSMRILTGYAWTQPFASISTSILES